MNSPYDRAAVTDDDNPLAWQERALCSQTDPESFFPEKGGSTRDAKRICVGCEVKAECLEYAVEHDERFGIYGGLSERERRRLKRNSPAAASSPAASRSARSRSKEEDIPISVWIERILGYLSGNQGQVTSTATAVGRAVGMPRPNAAIAIMHIMVQQELVEWVPRSRYPVLIKLLAAGENRAWTAA